MSEEGRLLAAPHANATVYGDCAYGVHAPLELHDRYNEATARLKPGDFDWNAVFANDVRWFRSGGIFASLSPITAELVVERLKAAKAVGAVISFELNQRDIPVSEKSRRGWPMGGHGERWIWVLIVLRENSKLTPWQESAFLRARADGAARKENGSRSHNKPAPITKTTER